MPSPLEAGNIPSIISPLSLGVLVLEHLNLYQWINRSKSVSFGFKSITHT